VVAQKIGGAIILTIVTFLLVYAVVFKDDFKKEDIDKVTPFLAVIFIIVLVFNILNMITKG
jgi:putative flippase GtrA